MRRRSIAFVASGNWSFVQRDREILEKTFLVRDVQWRGKRSILPLALAVLRSDLTFSWFALDHAYAACRLARTLGKRSIVVVGGVDAANRADLQYGVHLNAKMGPRSRYALAHSDIVLVVDDFLRDEIARNTGISRPEIRTIHSGFDTSWFQPDGGPKTSVLTVGAVDDTNVERKGLRVFVETARLVPELPFVLVGGRPNAATRRLRSIAPPNLRIADWLSDTELLEEFRRARVYVQASQYEGLPNALGEAMACECVPVGTSVAGIPTLMGDTGYFVPVNDPVATADAIREAYVQGDRARARQRIVEHFPVKRRQDAIDEVTTALLENVRKWSLRRRRTATKF
ncbi:MAG TPA: glycosyltransferase [Thermoplasmata archaeon]|nr:glycosyltransferase [Thermoplasmata archaeon]